MPARSGCTYRHAEPVHSCLAFVSFIDCKVGRAILLARPSVQVLGPASHSSLKRGLLLSSPHLWGLTHEACAVLTNSG